MAVKEKWKMQFKNKKNKEITNKKMKGGEKKKRTLKYK